MSRRHADNWSHPGHYLVDPYTWPWSPNGQDHIWPWKFKYQGHGQGQTHCQIWGLEFKSKCLLFVSWQSDHFWLRCSKFCIWPWKFKVKVKANVKSDGHIWGPEFNRCVRFSFRGNRTIFGRDIANSIFDLIQGQGHGQGQTRWSHLKPRVQSMCFLFVSWQSDHFWPKYSQFDIWPWKFKVKVKPDGPIWSLEFSQCVCFSFRGNRTIFGWNIANSIFDLENSRSRSRPRSNLMVPIEA